MITSVYNMIRLEAGRITGFFNAKNQGGLDPAQPPVRKCKTPGSTGLGTWHDISLTARRREPDTAPGVTARFC